MHTLNTHTSTTCTHVLLGDITELTADVVIVEVWIAFRLTSVFCALRATPHSPPPTHTHPHTSTTCTHVLLGDIEGLLTADVVVVEVVDRVQTDVRVLRPQSHTPQVHTRIPLPAHAHTCYWAILRNSQLM